MREAAGFILYQRDLDKGALFLLLRSAAHGDWGFPKGHRDEQDADLMATAKRELQEESSLELIDIDESFECSLEYEVSTGIHTDGAHTDKAYHKRVVYYLALCREPHKFRLSEEHSQFEWADVKRAKELLRFDDLRACLDQALKNIEGHKQ